MTKEKMTMKCEEKAVLCSGVNDKFFSFSVMKSILVIILFEESLKLIEGVEDEFQKFIDFACLDIVSFPDNINAEVRKDGNAKKVEQLLPMILN